MRIVCLVIVLLLAAAGIASAEELPLQAAENVDLRGFESFAQAHDADFSPVDLFAGLASGEVPDFQDFKGVLTEKLTGPLDMLVRAAGEMALPLLLLALMGAAVPDGNGSAALLCRIMLCRSAVKLAVQVMDAASECLGTTSAFSDAAAPVLTALMTAAGRTGGAALISPAAAMAGNLIGLLFQKYGLPICGAAACIALASNLSETTDLNRLVRLLKKLFNWGSGLAVTLFTALIFLRGGAASVSDSLALRTAKYAVDSVTPVIGSGVSDAWETYLAGLAAARRAVGFSGALLLLSVCLKPMLTMAAAMIALAIFSSALELIGEKCSARAFEQLSGVFHMALTMCGSAMAVWIILMGTVLSLGSGFA